MSRSNDQIADLVGLRCLCEWDLVKQSTCLVAEEDLEQIKRAGQCGAEHAGCLRRRNAIVSAGLLRPG